MVYFRTEFNETLNSLRQAKTHHIKTDTHTFYFNKKRTFPQNNKYCKNLYFSLVKLLLGKLTNILKIYLNS